MELRSHYSQGIISRLAECRNRMHITSTESSNGTKSTFTSTCNAVEAQISADTTQDMRGTLLITIPVVTTSAVVVSADTIALVLECYYTQNY